MIHVIRKLLDRIKLTIGICILRLGLILKAFASKFHASSLPSKCSSIIVLKSHHCYSQGQWYLLPKQAQAHIDIAESSHECNACKRSHPLKPSSLFRFAYSLRPFRHLHTWIPRGVTNVIIKLLNSLLLIEVYNAKAMNRFDAFAYDAKHRLEGSRDWEHIHTL